MPLAPADRLPTALLVTVFAATALSGVRPHDRLTWLLEVAPILVAVPLLVATRRRFPLTTLAYVLVALHALVLAVGGHYTYARVPLGSWAQEAFGLARNHYDRLGHLVQGFVPAIVARELLLRTSPLRRGGWLNFLVFAACLAISALYELVEWAAALVSAEAATAFLGTQGDVWDTQWDIFLAAVGALAALVLLAGAHDRALRRLAAAGAPAS